MKIESKNIIVVSTCMKIISSLYHFHFKGYFCGHKISNLILQNPLNFPINKGNDYIIVLLTQHIIFSSKSDDLNFLFAPIHDLSPLENKSINRVKEKYLLKN